MSSPTSGVMQTADSEGRIVLGEEYAGRTFVISRTGDAVFLQPVAVVPDREAWLYANREAIASVCKGLQQARDGRSSLSPPDLDADAALISRLEE